MPNFIKCALCIPCFEASLAPDVDEVVLDGDPVVARPHAGEEGQVGPQVHRQKLFCNNNFSFLDSLNDRLVAIFFSIN